MFEVINTTTTEDRAKVNQFLNQVCELLEQKFQTGMRIAKVNIHGDIVIRNSGGRAQWLAQQLAVIAKAKNINVEFEVN